MLILQYLMIYVMVLLQKPHPHQLILLLVRLGVLLQMVMMMVEEAECSIVLVPLYKFASLLEQGHTYIDTAWLRRGEREEVLLLA